MYGLQLAAGLGWVAVANDLPCPPAGRRAQHWSACSSGLGRRTGRRAYIYIERGWRQSDGLFM